MMFLVGVGAGLCSSGSAAPVGADRLYMSVRADMFGILVGMVSSTVGDTVTVVGVVLPDGLCPATGILSVSGFVELAYGAGVGVDSGTGSTVGAEPWVPPDVGGSGRTVGVDGLARGGGQSEIVSAVVAVCGVGARGRASTASVDAAGATPVVGVDPGCGID
jgi:hypothetical protein